MNNDDEYESAWEGLEDVDDREDSRVDEFEEDEEDDIHCERCREDLL